MIRLWPGNRSRIRGMSTRMLAMAPRVIGNPVREGEAPWLSIMREIRMQGKTIKWQGCHRSTHIQRRTHLGQLAQGSKGARKSQIVMMAGTQRWRELGIRGT